MSGCDEILFYNNQKWAKKRKRKTKTWNSFMMFCIFAYFISSEYNYQLASVFADSRAVHLLLVRWCLLPIFSFYFLMFSFVVLLNLDVIHLDEKQNYT